jgi:hypothetical protein
MFVRKRTRTTNHGEEEERGSPTLGHGHEEKGPPAAGHGGKARQPPAMGKRRKATGHGEEGGGASGAAHQRWWRDWQRIVGGLSGLKACWDSNSEFLTIQTAAL